MASSSNNGKANILLVDDRPENLLALEACLADLGQHVLRAGSGAEALRHLLASEVAVILLDVDMPGLDGLETARLIRARPQNRQTPIVFVTAHDADEGKIAAAYALGAADFLRKPLRPEILKAKVATFVQLATHQLQAAAHSADEQARTILESITDAFFALDREWRFTYVNRQAEVTLGRSREDLLGRSIWSAYPGLADSRFEQVYRGAAVDRVALSVTKYYPDHERWYEVHAYPAPEGISVYFRDVTERQQSERHLRESEARLEAALAIANLGTFEWNLTSDAVTLDDRSREIFGIAAGKGGRAEEIFRRIHPADRERVVAEAQASRSSMSRLKTEYRVVHPDGAVRTIVSINDAVPGLDGRATYMVGIFDDITERKRAEVALAEQHVRADAERRLLDAVLEALPVGVIIAEPSGKLLRMNRANNQLWGNPPPRASGSGSIEEYREWVGYWPETGKQVEPHEWALARALTAGESVTGELVEIEPFDGSGRRLMINTASPVRDADGVIVAGVIAEVDVTERVRAEQALQATAARLRFLDALGEATRSATDPEEVMRITTQLLGEHLGTTRCAYADVEADNNCFFIRHDWTTAGAGSTVGTYSLELFGSRAVADVRSGRTLIVRDVDAELAPSDGSDMFNAIGIKAIVCCPLVKQGGLLAMMAVHQAGPRDWTPDEVSLVEEVVERSWAHIERVRSAAALQEADQRKDEFLAILAHELRNPLAPIRTGLQVMRVAPDDAAAVARARATMERQLAQMVRLVDDLLDVSRITRGLLELRRETVQLSAVVQSAVETSRPAIEGRGHHLTVRLPAAAVYLNADAMRLAQVFANLLNNAAKYTPEVGAIWLTAEMQEAEVVVSVRDSGVGIPPAMLPRVFEVFTQVDRTVERAQGGLGIGLTLVKRLVELHGGSVEAHSAGKGQGSEFIVRLPVVAAPAPVRVEAPSTVPEAITRRVLVVDDNRDAAESMVDLLQLHRHEVTAVHDGEAAVHAALAFRPDLILLDIGLPKMNGYDVCRRIRELPGGDRIFIAALTGWGQEEDRRRSSEAGFDLHLVKPVDPAALEELIRQPRGSRS